MCLKNSYFYLLFLILLASCANVVTPQGGPKDTVTPFAISSNPKDSNLNFVANKITINFSENIQIKEPEKSITISPALGSGNFSVETDKAKLIIKLKKTKPNTTYTINAINSIADITEGNTLPEFKYIFSTGPTIDSFKISGIVITASTLAPVKNSLVCLYKNYTDSIILKSDPDYFTYTKENGRFELENLSLCNYKLIVIEDKNNNKRWEIGEEIGVVDSTIQVDSIPKKFIVRQFKNVESTYHLISAQSITNGIYEFEFDEYIKIINQEDPSMSKKERYSIIAYEESCFLSNYKKYVLSSLNPKDSAHFNYQIKDSLYKVSVKVAKGNPQFEPIKYLYNFRKKDKYYTIPSLRTLDTNSIKYEKVKLYKDTTQITDNSLSFNWGYLITLDNLERGTYKLILGKGAITDELGVENDSFQVTINILDDDELQTLTIKTDSTFKNTYQLRLSSIDNDYCKKDTIQSNQNYNYNNLIPGKYKLIIYETLNPVLLSPTGNFFNKKLPEKIVYYKEIELKTGFDIEETIGIMYE